MGAVSTMTFVRANTKLKKEMPENGEIEQSCSLYFFYFFFFLSVKNMFSYRIRPVSYKLDN